MKYLFILFFSSYSLAQSQILEEINQRLILSKREYDRIDNLRSLSTHKAPLTRKLNGINVERFGLNKDLEHYENFQKQKPNLSFCNENFQEIDLEKTVFKDLPQDHQNGLGTCYANVSKNIIYALTNGSVDASFIDLSLSTNMRGYNYLKGGSVCSIMAYVQEVGYCNKKNSPLEIGENLDSLNFLDPKFKSTISHMNFIDLVNDYIKNKNEYVDKFGTEEFRQHIIKAVKALQENPKIELPYPKLGDLYLPETNAKTLYYHYRDYKIRKNHSLTEYLNDYENAKSSFYQKLSAKALQGEKIDLKDDFKNSFKDFIKKYKLDIAAQERIFSKQGSVAKKLPKFNEEEYRKKVLATQAFLNSQTSLNSLQKQLYCKDQNQLEHSTLSNLQGIIGQARKMKVDLDKLLEQDAFIDGKKLMQYIVTPNCINRENRNYLNDMYSCRRKNIHKMAKWYGIDTASYMRLRVYEQLQKNMPVGKNFANHVNTIVGMRFNKRTNSCEYKIRESQKAESFWQTEEDALKDIKHLSIVDKI